jgi:hypothetical protein
MCVFLNNLPLHIKILECSICLSLRLSIHSLISGVLNPNSPRMRAAALTHGDHGEPSSLLRTRGAFLHVHDVAPSAGSQHNSPFPLLVKTSPSQGAGSCACSPASLADQTAAKLLAAIIPPLCCVATTGARAVFSPSQGVSFVSALTEPRSVLPTRTALLNSEAR